jgi:flagellar biosynthetic protein FliO
VALLSLGLVCVLAYAVLRFLSRRGFGHASGPIRILARCALEPRRSLYLIEVAGRRLLVGTGDGSMTTLADLGPEAPGSAAASPMSAPPDLALVVASAPGPAPGGSGAAGADRGQVPGAPAPAGFSAVLQKVRAQRPGAGTP